MTDQVKSAEEPETIEPPLTMKQRRFTWFFSAAAFFVSYVLTAGPAVFIAEKFDQPMVGAIMEVIYAPLIIIIKLRVPVLAPIIKGYVGLFQ